MAARIISTSFLLFVASRCDVLEGPGDNARVIPNADDIPAEQLPLEHRGPGGLLLPDVFSISRNVTSHLDVDLFFSLFFVFLNNDVSASSEQFTIFAPSGLETQEATRWLSAEERLTEELLLNHIVTGKHLNPVTSLGQQRSTLGGLEVEFSVDEDGELWVNDVRILAWKTEGQALIIALEDYLFKREVEQEVKKLGVTATNELTSNGAESEEEWGEDRGGDLEIEASVKTEEFEPTPRKSNKKCSQVENKSGLAIFKTITVCTENVSVNASAKTERRIDSSSSLLEQLDTQLAFLRGGPGLDYFLTYANQTNLESLFNPKNSYTLLAPVDRAFQSWHPIDWGFNPFLVESFLADLFENLVLDGNINASDNDEKSKSFTTLGGKKVFLSFKGENTYVNDILVVGDLPFSGGSDVIFLDEVPWMTEEIVENLRENYSHLETGPPVFNGSIDSLNIGSTIIIEESKKETGFNPVDAEQNLEDNKMHENDDLVFTPDDLVNFPSTTNSEPQTEDILKTNKTSPSENKVVVDPVNFPPVTNSRFSDDSGVKFYNKSVDNNASLVVLRLKQLLQSEIDEDVKKKQDDDQRSKQQKRIVYINNQRVELGPDEA